MINGDDTMNRKKLIKICVWLMSALIILIAGYISFMQIEFCFEFYKIFRGINNNWCCYFWIMFTIMFTELVICGAYTFIRDYIDKKPLEYFEKWK